MTCVVCPVLRPSEKPRDPAWRYVCDACHTWIRRELAALPDNLAALSLEPGRGGGQKVSGTREAPVPLRLDVLDLQLGAHPGSRKPRTRAWMGVPEDVEDQVGALSVATDLWHECRDWITVVPATYMPEPTVTDMV